MLFLLEWRPNWALTGELWRPITGHLAHWSWAHLGMDLGMFACLGFFMEGRSRRGVLGTILMTLLLSELLLQGTGGYSAYRGLSDLSVSLFSLLMLEFVLEGKRERQGISVLLGVGGWLLVLGKLLYELYGDTAFAASQGFEVAAGVHVAGLLAPVVYSLVKTQLMVLVRKPLFLSGETRKGVR